MIAQIRMTHPRFPKALLSVALLACVCISPVFSAPHPSVPATWEVINEIHKDLDDLCRRNRHYFKAYADSTLQGMQAENAAKRAIIAPLYQKAFNSPLPAALPDEAPPDELAGLTDGKLYMDAWRKLIAEAPIESSNYMTKKVAPILADPTTDRAAVMRIQKDANTEWEKYKGVAADTFLHDITQIDSDFHKGLPAIARDHRDLRQALSAIVGQIPPGDFDAHFQKYVDAAEAKLKPPAPVIVQEMPVPVPASTPEEAAKSSPTPAPMAQVAPLKASLEELASRLDGQKKTLAAVKLQAQMLDDNYPALHREMSSEVEKLVSAIFWLRLVLAVVAGVALIATGIAVTALDAKKTNGDRKKQTSQAQSDEPLKLVLERLYNIETELSQLQEQLIPGAKSPSDNDITPE